MALPANVQMVILHGKYMELDGDVAPAGTITFNTNVVLRNPSAGVIVIPVEIKKQIVQGEFTAELPTTDDIDNIPVDWMYFVQESFNNGFSRRYGLKLKVNLAQPPEVVELASLTPIALSGVYTGKALVWDNILGRPSDGGGFGAGGPDLWSITPEPLYIAHRLGGGVIAPENSTYAAELIEPLDIIFETDVQELQDGVLAIMHDTTVDRTLTTTGQVNKFNTFQWRELRHNTTDRSGYQVQGQVIPDYPPPFFQDVVDRWGGKRILLLESKDTVETAQKICNEIQRRGLQRAAMVTSFDQAHLDLAVARGIPTMWNTNIPEASDVAAKGYDYVSVTRGSVTQQLVDEMHAAGIKVSAYTINRRTHRDQMLAMGVDAIVTEDPFYTPINVGRTTDPFDGAKMWPPGTIYLRGSQPMKMDTTNGGRFGFGNLTWGATAPPPTTCIAGWASPVGSSTFRIRFKVDFGVGAFDQARYALLYFCMPNDDGIMESSGGSTAGNGYSLTIRRNGTCGINVITNGVSTGKTGWSAGVPWTPDINTAGTAFVEVEVLPTILNIRRLNTDGTVNIQSTETNMVYYGNRYIGLGASGTEAMFRDFTITPL
jgi:glycerophosphoryl diester phosphodiesterase